MNAQHCNVMDTNVAGGWLHVAGGPDDPGRLGQAASGRRPGLAAAAGSRIYPTLSIPVLPHNAAWRKNRRLGDSISTAVTRCRRGGMWQDLIIPAVCRAWRWWMMFPVRTACSGSRASTSATPPARCPAAAQRSASEAPAHLTMEPRSRRIAPISKVRGAAAVYTMHVFDSRPAGSVALTLCRCIRRRLAGHAGCVLHSDVIVCG